MKTAWVYILQKTLFPSFTRDEKIKVLKEGDELILHGIEEYRYRVQRLSDSEVEFQENGNPAYFGSNPIPNFTLKKGHGHYFDDSPQVICGGARWLVLVEDIEEEHKPDMEQLSKLKKDLALLSEEERKFIHSRWVFGLEEVELATDMNEPVYYDNLQKRWRCKKVEEMYDSILDHLKERGYSKESALRLLGDLNKLLMYEAQQDTDEEEKKEQDTGSSPLR